MDWDWKDFEWDSIELEEKEDSSVAGLVGSSNSGGQKNRGLTVDLKLGRVSDLEERSADALKDRGASTIRSSPSGPLKRTRVLGGTQNVSCLVDGCKSDLSICREYHRRHRVCERHSKTPVVIIGGKEQRFCQQCSRFHSLGEFDEVKRSCRKRLDGHNMRRRKSQPEPLYLNSEKFLSKYKGPRILQFSSPHIYATTTLRSTWPGIASAEAQAMVYNHHQRLHITDGQRPPNSFAFIYNEENKMFSFLQENGPKVGNQATPEASLFQALPNGIASTESGRGGHNMLSGGLTQSIDLGCALYLLSSHPTQTPAIGNGPKVGNQAAPEASLFQALPNSIASTESGRGGHNMLSGGLTQPIDLGCALYLLSSHPTQTPAIGLSHLPQSSVSHPIQSLGSGQQFNGVSQYSCSHGVKDKSAGIVLVPDTNETNIYCNGVFQGALDGLLESEASRTLPIWWE